jgi:hypothetical protein
MIKKSVSRDVTTADFVADPRIYSGGHFTGPYHTTGARGVWSPDYLPACESGWVCIHVLNFQNAEINGWSTYKLYEYGVYDLDDFGRDGWIVNNQTDGAKAVLWAEDMDQTFGTYYPSGNFNGVDWNPVWHVELKP